MLLQHFQLSEQPFGVTPDPRFVFASVTHREALASLLYGIESNLGFIVLIAKPGMGKTSLLFDVLGRASRVARTVFIFQTISTPEDLFRALLIDLGTEDVPSSLVDMQTRLNKILVEEAGRGRTLIVAIDEAQNLNELVLEALRMLSNFETSTRKLVQIILSGQLQLADKLALPSMLQLRQRVSILAYLRPLDFEDTASYIEHRLAVAGNTSKGRLFDRAAIELIYRHSEGIPRNINNLCFNALSLACAVRSNAINADIVKEVLQDLALDREKPEGVTSPAIEEGRPLLAPSFTPVSQGSRTPLIFGSLAACCVLLLGTWLALGNRNLPLPWAIAAPTPQSVSAVTPSLPQAQAKASKPVTPALTSVLIRKGQSLTQVCAESYGSCEPGRLKEIMRVNPGILNPDHIQPRESVLLPMPTSTLKTTK